MKSIARPFCTRPFEWFELHQNGDVFLCCPAWTRRPVGNLLRQSVGEIWNGPAASELRTHVLNGSFHGCRKSHCPWLRQHQPPVYVTRDQLPSSWQQVASQRKPQLSFGPTTLNLCCDPRCNLRCVSCRNEMIELCTEEQHRLNTLMMTVQQQLAPHITHLRLSGHGDPFAAPAYGRLLHEVSAASWPQLKTVHLHSNGQLWTAERWRTLPALHPYVQTAEISIDAADERVYRLNRGPGWGRLMSNLAFIQQLPIDLTFSCVVQANNYHQIPAFIAMSRRFGAQAYFSRLVNWGTFSRKDFHHREVWRQQHPEFGRFQEIVAAVKDQPDVTLGNLLIDE